MKITKVINTKDTILYRLAIENIHIFFETYEKKDNAIYLMRQKNTVASIHEKENFYEALNESNSYIEDAIDFQENQNCPGENISNELESKKEINDIQIAKGIREAARYQRNFKATIKNRIKENNGQHWIKDFSKNYYWEDVLKNITGNTKQWEITPVLKKYKIKFNKREEELYINTEPTQGHYSECEEFFKTTNGETFKLRWDYYHEEILEISRP